MYYVYYKCGINTFLIRGNLFQVNSKRDLIQDVLIRESLTDALVKTRKKISRQNRYALVRVQNAGQKIMARHGG